MAANKQAETNKLVKDNEVKEEIKTTKKTTQEIDIDAVIKQAVTQAVSQAVAETSSKYQTAIDDLLEKNKELENKIAVTNQGVSGFNSNKRVKIMHMGVGSANFSKGRINVNFDEPFEVRDVRYDIFEEMYDMFGDWFRNFELVVLDKDVREYVGLEYAFKQYGADKSTFEEILKSSNKECLDRVNRLKPMLAMTFLKYFIDEYLKSNPNAITKFADISNYYKTHHGINEMQSAIQEMVE